MQNSRQCQKLSVINQFSVALILHSLESIFLHMFIF